MPISIPNLASVYLNASRIRPSCCSVVGKEQINAVAASGPVRLDAKFHHWPQHRKITGKPSKRKKGREWSGLGDPAIYILVPTAGQGASFLCNEATDSMATSVAGAFHNPIVFGASMQQKVANDWLPGRHRREPQLKSDVQVDRGYY